MKTLDSFKTEIGRCGQTEQSVRNRARSYLASLVLGREFNESVESFIDRKGWNKNYCELLDWCQ